MGGKEGMHHASQVLVHVKHGNIMQPLFHDEQGC